MTQQTGQLEYWRAGSEEERQLRVFISHRYGEDKALYDGVIDALNREGFSVQDMSLTEDRRKKGPRGGDLPPLAIQAEIAARIYTSDVVIAPSRPATSRSWWLTWEIQTATIGYGIPILFVKERGLVRQTQMVAQVAALGLPHRVSDPDRSLIVRNVAELVKDTRPTRAVRLEETDPTIEFRGPTRAALDAVMAKAPYHPRLPPPNSPAPEPPKGPFWNGWFGRGR